MSDSHSENRLRFSLADALGVTALLAVAAAPASWLGDRYVAQAAVSLVFLTWTAWCACKRWPLLFVVSCVPALIIAAATFSSAIFLQVVCTAFVLLITIPLGERPRLRVAACAVVMVVAYWPTLTNAIAADKRTARMREAWPLVSIRERLPKVSHVEVAREISEEQEEGLAVVQASRGQRFGRGELPGMLARLHHASYARFARMPGFGFYRMGPLTEYALASAAEQLRPVEAAFPMPIVLAPGGIKDGELHRDAAMRFLDRERLGYFHSVDNVAGFMGHGFDRMVASDPSRRTTPDTGGSQPWRLERLDLIGLMREDAPVAYVSDSLPDMEQLRTSPTRALNGFETDALEQIRADREVVVEGVDEEGDASSLRMLGALRAGESCATCHNVPPGTLLGAFSYELTRIERPDATPRARSLPSTDG